MNEAIPVLNEYDYPQWYVIQGIAVMEYPPLGTWQVAMVRMYDTETNAYVWAFGGGA